TQLTQNAVTPTSETTTGPATRSRLWVQRYLGPGVAINDATSNPLGDLDPWTISLHNAPGVQSFTSSGDRLSPRNRRCLVINANFQNAVSDPVCGLSNS